MMSEIFVKDLISFDTGLFSYEYLNNKKLIESPKLFDIKIIPHSYANNFVKHHHYLKRKIYIAKNVSYGLFFKESCYGVAMFGYPVWREFKGLVPPNESAQCPELIRACTVGDLPKNTESYFLSKTIKSLLSDWEKETGVIPKCVTSLCDNKLGFSGALYKALNFQFHAKTKGRDANIGEAHGKWGVNNKPQGDKTMYVYWYDRNKQVDTNRMGEV